MIDMSTIIPQEVIAVSIGFLAGSARSFFDYIKDEEHKEFSCIRYLASVFIAGFVGVVTGWLGSSAHIQSNLLYFLISVMSFSGGGIMELYLKTAKDKFGI